MRYTLTCNDCEHTWTVRGEYEPDTNTTVIRGDDTVCDECGCGAYEIGDGEEEDDDEYI